MKNKTKYVCDKCSEPAEYNLQSGGYALWDLNDKNYPDFSSAKIWGLGDEENSFYCKKCAEEEGII